MSRVCVCVNGECMHVLNVDFCARMHFWQYINKLLVITCISTCSSHAHIHYLTSNVQVSVKHWKTSYIPWTSTCVFKSCQLKHLFFCDILKGRIVFVFISTVSFSWPYLMLRSIAGFTKFNNYLGFLACLDQICHAKRPSKLQKHQFKQV